MGSDNKLDGAGDNEDRNRNKSGLLETEAWWRCLVAHSSLDRAGAARRGAGASAGVGTGPAREQFKTMIKRGWCMAGSGLWVVHCTSLANLHVVCVSARRARRTSSGQSGRARQLHASPLLSSSHLFSSHRFLLSSLVWLIDQPSTHIPCLITNEIVKIRPFQTYVFYTDSI